MANRYKITPPQCYLRPINRRNVLRYMCLSHDAELIETMGWKPFRSNEHERFMRTIEVITVPKIKTGKTITFSIVACKHQQHIGYVTLKGLSEKKSYAELGIAIMDDLYRSQGYGSQALKHARSYAFEKLELSEIYLTVFPSNITAIKAYKKIGFQQIRFLKNHWVMPNGQKTDLLLMRLLQKKEIE